VLALAVVVIQKKRERYDSTNPINPTNPTNPTQEVVDKMAAAGNNLTHNSKRR
jgi:hypothetical protein